MEDYFAQIQQTTQPQQYTPPAFEFNHQPDHFQPASGSKINLQPNAAFLHLESNVPHYEDQDNEFDQFEEDEVAKRIREDQEKVQNQLREKSNKEWEEKKRRQEEGKRLLEEYLAKKQVQKQERAAENIRKEAQIKQDNAKLNVEAGWKKVINNINVRQGQRAGSKDTNRMRESILHRREDDAK